MTPQDIASLQDKVQEATESLNHLALQQAIQTTLTAKKRNMRSFVMNFHTIIQIDD